MGNTRSALVSTNVNVSSRDELNKQFVDKLSTKLWLDSSRSAIVFDTACTLYRLVVSKNLRGATAYRRLILGRKGVGKSMLLENLCIVSDQILRSRGLITVYASLDDKENRDVLITDIIAREFKSRKLALPAACSINELEQFLEEHDKALFLVLDEIHLAYTSHSAVHGKDIIQQVLSIGSSRRGRIHCVLSGSSTVVRRLCFAKITSEEAERGGYVNYIPGLDLNSTKFTPLWIHPFLDATDFAQATRFLSAGDDSLDFDQLATLYMITGGNDREMEKAVTNPLMTLSPPYLLTRLGQLSEHTQLNTILRKIVDLVK
jgi:hypothetical protein